MISVIHTNQKSSILPEILLIPEELQLVNGLFQGPLEVVLMDVKIILVSIFQVEHFLIIVELVPALIIDILLLNILV